MLTVRDLWMAALHRLPPRSCLARHPHACADAKTRLFCPRRGGGTHDALRRAVLQRLPGTLRARQAKADALKVDKPFACVRLSRLLSGAMPSASRLH